MVRSVQRSRGFSFVELTIVLGVMALLAIGVLPYMESQRQIGRAHKTATEMRTLLEAGLAYYSANTAWPADGNVLVASGYASASDLINPWGSPYTVQPNGMFLEVRTTFLNHPNIGVEKLPNSAAAGNVVTARVVVPGTETAHERLLNRYGDAGRNTMMTTLDMNGNPVNNTTEVNVLPGSRMTVQGGDVDIKSQTNIWTNSYGLVLKDELGATNAAPEAAAGSADVNDMHVRSLTGNQWLSRRLSRFVEMESYFAEHGDLVAKPTCPGGTPKIFVVPQLVVMDLMPNTFGAHLSRARNVSATFWQVDLLTYGPSGAGGGAPDAAGAAIAKTYCYY